MNTALLGIITACVLLMAAIQCAAVVLAARAARRLERLATRLEQDIRPIVDNVQQVTSDAARASALAFAQVERADRLLTQAAVRIEQVLGLIPTIVGGARGGASLVSLLTSLLSTLRARRAPAGPASAEPEDEDALFIG